MRRRYIDALRLIAIFYMFFQHSTLILLKQNENSGLTKFLFEIVPFCSALFLFICGLSLTLSFEKYKSKINFILRLLLRGIILIIFSSILFLIENGFQFPDVIFSSGILNTIGLFILLAIPIFIFDNTNIKLLLTFIILTILTTITIYLDIKKIYIYPFNYAYESISPTIIFGFIGLFVGLVMNNKNYNKLREKTIVLLIFIVGIVILSISFMKFGLLKAFYSEIGRYTIERIYNTKYLLFNLSDNSFSQFFVSTWNFNNFSFITAIGTTFFLFSLLYFLEPLLNKINYFFIMPGKYAFINYFFHFIIIAIVVLNAGYNSFSKIQLYIFLTILFLLSFILSNYLEFKKNKKI